LEELRALFSGFPSWAGSVPLWGIFFMAVIALIKAWPKLKEIGVQERQGIRDPYVKRIRELAEDVKQCRKECDEQEVRLRREMEEKGEAHRAREEELKGEIDALKNKMNNEAWQRVQSEISLVRTLIQVVDAPELRVILEALQKRSAIMPAEVTAISGPLGDTGGIGK
jgi:hypothetical protein